MEEKELMEIQEDIAAKEETAMMEEIALEGTVMMERQRKCNGEVIKSCRTHKEQHHQKMLEKVKMAIQENSMSIQHIPVKIAKATKKIW